MAIFQLFILKFTMLITVKKKGSSMPTPERIEKMRKVIANRQPDLTVICENIHDPHNVSAILRSCDAVGIQSVKLLYTYQEFPKLGKKSSASAKKWLDIERFDDPQRLRSALKAAGYTIYATHLAVENPISIYDIDWTAPSAIIMGNEHFGVSDDALAIADHSVYIPMFGMIQSLNVSVATAVILYEACRQRIAKNMYPREDLPTNYQSDLLNRWLDK